MGGRSQIRSRAGRIDVSVGNPGEVSALAQQIDHLFVRPIVVVPTSFDGQILTGKALRILQGLWKIDGRSDEVINPENIQPAIDILSQVRPIGLLKRRIMIGKIMLINVREGRPHRDEADGAKRVAQPTQLAIIEHFDRDHRSLAVAQDG